MDCYFVRGSTLLFETLPARCEAVSGIAASQMEGWGENMDSGSHGFLPKDFGEFKYYRGLNNYQYCFEGSI